MVNRCILFFFFQAEDGIRDYKVTGVQTCALPISLPQYSRALLQAWIESGAVQVEGRALRAKDKVLGGEQVRIEAQLAAHTAAAAEAIPLAVLFQDPSLFIINKPPGLVVHPGAGNARQTLPNELLALDPQPALLPPP